ncbi:fructosamine kinase family protein [Methylosoma difficile]
MNTFNTIAEQIQTATGQAFTAVASSPVAGGDINSAFCLEGFGQRYFVKQNRANLVPMFEAELLGLQAIAATKTIKVPQPIICGLAEDHAFLVLEFVDFGYSSRLSEQKLGQQLARLHQVPQAYFGWERDNTIGTTSQLNPRSEDWVSFWQNQRLAYLLRLAAERGYRGKLQSQGERLCADLPSFFAGYQPLPSLLHGDLWGGNAAVDKQGNPLIFDPACYFGDREADLAMTELFGGFGAEFYAAYQDVWPLDQGYAVRKILYNLYHILNHMNLFGSGYLSQAEAMIGKLLAELS